MAASTFLTRIESYRDPTVLWPLAAVASVVAHGLVLLGLRPWLITLQPQPESLPEPIPIQLLGDPQNWSRRELRLQICRHRHPMRRSAQMLYPASHRRPPSSPLARQILPLPPSPLLRQIWSPQNRLPRMLLSPCPRLRLRRPPVRHRPLSYPHLLPA